MEAKPSRNTVRQLHKNGTEKFGQPDVQRVEVVGQVQKNGTDKIGQLDVQGVEVVGQEQQDGTDKIGQPVVQRVEVVGQVQKNGTDKIGQLDVQGVEVVGQEQQDGTNKIGQPVVQRVEVVGQEQQDGTNKIGQSVVQGVEVVGQEQQDGTNKIGQPVVRRVELVGQEQQDGTNKIGQSVVQGVEVVGQEQQDGTNKIGQSVVQRVEVVGQEQQDGTNRIGQLGVQEVGQEKMQKDKDPTKPKGRREDFFLPSSSNTHREEDDSESFNLPANGTVIIINTTKAPSLTDKQFQHILFTNLQGKLDDDWNTSIEKMIFEENGASVYIKQIISAYKVTSKKRKLTEHRSLQSCLQNGPLGQRIVIYALAGMGKTTLLRHIARSWAENCLLFGRFEYVFFIPMRLVRSHTIRDILCRDLELVPLEYKDKLQEVLNCWANKILFLLDSYEEFSFDEDDDIDKLIRRKIFVGCAVVVTSRPGSRLREKERHLTPYIAAQLQELSDERIDEYFSCYTQIKGASLSQDEFRRVYLGKEFLKRPINLALASHLSSAMAAGDLATQTALLGEILHHILMAYVKKRSLPTFQSSGTPFMLRHDIPFEARAKLHGLGRMCLTALKSGRRLLYIRDSVYASEEDLMQLGLFKEGPELGSIVLPHPLIQEYLAAEYLSADKTVWKEILEQITCKTQEKTMSLEEAVNPLENVIKFVVGIRPDSVSDLLTHIVIKRVHSNGFSQPSLNFELDLLRECKDEAMKSAIAQRLLEAPVYPDEDRQDWMPNRETDELLRFYSKDQSFAFLHKAYGCDLEKTERNVINCTTDDEFFLDSFVVGCVARFGCSVEMEDVRMVNCELPIKVMQQNMKKPQSLTLTDCKLLPGLHDHRSVSASLQELELQNLQGFQNLRGTVMPGVQTLLIWYMAVGSKDFEVLRSTFTGLEHLEFLTCKLPKDARSKDPVDQVRTLEMHNCGEVHVHSLAQTFTQVEIVFLWMSKLLVDARDKAELAPRWPTVRKLGLTYARLQTLSGEHFSGTDARRTLSNICSSAEIDFSQYGKRI